MANQVAQNMANNALPYQNFKNDQQNWYNQLAAAALSGKQNWQTMLGYLIGNKFLKKPFNNWLDNIFKSPSEKTTEDTQNAEINTDLTNALAHAAFKGNNASTGNNIAQSLNLPSAAAWQANNPMTSGEKSTGNSAWDEMTQKMAAENSNTQIPFTERYKNKDDMLKRILGR